MGVLVGGIVGGIEGANNSPLELAHLEKVLKPHDCLDVQHVSRLCIRGEMVIVSNSIANKVSYRQAEERQVCRNIIIVKFQVFQHSPPPPKTAYLANSVLARANLILHPPENSLYSGHHTMTTPTSHSPLTLSALPASPE